MKWEKIGRIFKSKGQHPWMQSHASLPFALPINDKIVRIFFSPRDSNNNSYISWLEINIDNPLKILRVFDQPFLSPRGKGYFDDCGVMPSWIYPKRHGYEFLYIGWNVRNTVPFHHGIGRINIDLRTEKIEDSIRPNGPFFDRNEDDPFYVTNPCVLKVGGVWRMWYLSGVGWEDSSNSPKAKYLVKSATSVDSNSWERDCQNTLSFQSDNEIAIARPSVYQDNNGFHMFFSHRSKTQNYRIGYAFSKDSYKWIRDNSPFQLQPDDSGWDSEMMAYPHVFKLKNEVYMLYCGNGYSYEGFGIAKLTN